MFSTHPSGSKPEISSKPLSASMVEDATKAETAQSTKQADENKAATFIYELRPSDVLLGRGSRTDQYPGNLAYREVVKRCKREYSTTADHEAKRAIAEYIIAQVETNQGRFLRRIEPNSNEAIALGVSISNNDSNPKSVWVMIGKEAAIEKTKQALREKGNASRAKKLVSQRASHSAGGSTSGGDDSGCHGGVKRNTQYRLDPSLYHPVSQVQAQPSLLSSFRPSHKTAALSSLAEFSSVSTAPVPPASSLSMPGTASDLLQTEQRTRQQVPHQFNDARMALLPSSTVPSIQQLLRTQQLRLELQRQQHVVLLRQQTLRHHLQRGGQSFTSMANLGGHWSGSSLATLSPAEAAFVSLLQQQQHQRPTNQELPSILSVLRTR
jgi:hypothetical protein